MQNYTGTMNILERELAMCRLQVNRLLDITQAINNNLPAADLFQIYKTILNWELGIGRMALFVKEGKYWSLATSLNVNQNLLSSNVSDHLLQFDRPTNIHSEIKGIPGRFDLVIPVYHKKEPIAFALIGDFEKPEDKGDKIKFITTITNIIAVAIENKRLFKRQLEQERLKREMDLAGKVQQMLIPSRLPNSHLLEMASIYLPHLGVGGDYFDCVELPDGKLAFCVVDFSGKGVAAALLMANFEATFQMLVQEQLPTEKFIRKLNQAVLRITKGERFMTMFFGLYDQHTKMLEYVNAGHNPPVLYMNDSLELLREGCTILGAFDELPSLDVCRMQLTDDSLLIAYTDGLTDLLNENDEFFDLERLKQFVDRYRFLSATRFNERLLKHIDQFKGERQFTDDIAILTLKIPEVS